MAGRLRREGRPLARLHPKGLLAALRHRRVGALPDHGPRTGAHPQLRDPFPPAGLRRPLRPGRPEPPIQRNGQAAVAELEPSRGQRRPRARAPVASRHRLGPRPVQAGRERKPGHLALSRSRTGPGLLLPGQAPLRDHVPGQSELPLPPRRPAGRLVFPPVRPRRRDGPVLFRLRREPARFRPQGRPGGCRHRSGRLVLTPLNRT
ncbi:MAG: hypothetical protein MZV64_11035 [Ignavibacteriales bacterium]|nr:hypothetical protein [Ignavibacteriales bacterium]